MTISIAADAADPGSPLAHSWSEVVGAGRAAEGLRAGWQEHLKDAAGRCGFRYVRFHGLFHDDMFVLRQDAAGRIYHTFHYVDDVFDRMLESGVRPFVEFGFSPGALAREHATTFWWGANGAPPTDMAAWKDLITATVRHWIGRYGADEVARWYFEVWNEPNLHNFFRGTRSEYFALYEATVRAVKAVDPRLRVGGPATSNFVPDARFEGEREDTAQHAVVLDAENLDALDWRPVWLEEFLGFCAARGLPVDFVSTHPYPTDWALDGHGGQHKEFVRGSDATVRDLRLLREIVDSGPYPDAEIHLTEWNSSPSPRDHAHDHMPAATFVVKSQVESAGLVDSLAHWVFTDVFEEGGAGDGIFHGGFGMVTYQGVPKPVFHAYRMLHALGDELLARAPGAVATRHGGTGTLAVLAYHYPEQQRSAPPKAAVRDEALAVQRVGEDTPLRVELRGLRPGARVVVETLAVGSGDATTAWRSMGSPDFPTREQTAELRAAAEDVRRRELAADGAGTFVLAETVTPWSVVLVREER
ncbi:GH39 family glycosyl hydrolase [Streptomyces sp. DW26H14]|uniref:GH39 family glycosyl hydrolase n=1 Tax=Streptomyces sp. DW26H14 TaxID=3435395 RepID=UPI00403DA46F